MTSLERGVKLQAKLEAAKEKDRTIRALETKCYQVALEEENARYIIVMSNEKLKILNEDIGRAKVIMTESKEKRIHLETMIENASPSQVAEIQAEINALFDKKEVE